MHHTMFVTSGGTPVAVILAVSLRDRSLWLQPLKEGDRSWDEFLGAMGNQDAARDHRTHSVSVATVFKAAMILPTKEAPPTVEKVFGPKTTKVAKTEEKPSPAVSSKPKAPPQLQLPKINFSWLLSVPADAVMPAPQPKLPVLKSAPPMPAPLSAGSTTKVFTGRCHHKSRA